MAFTQNKGVRIHWQARGAGTPLLLVMGHRYSSALWYPLLDALAAKHRVIWFDNRGTGETDTVKGFAVSDMTDDALAVMDAAGVERAHVFGVSMGGVIVLDLAVRAPERVISLTVGASGILSAEKPRMPKILLALYYLPPSILKRLTPSRDGDQGYGSAASADQIAFDLAVLAKDRFTVSGVVAQAAAVAGHVQTAEAVAAVTLPSLVLHGGDDSLVPIKWAEELAATLPNSAFVTLEGAGHNFMVAAREETLRALDAFIDRVDNAT
ncbi:MAG: alpha/beta hydrolase [Caulobacter sp.]|nr:alpha/beta hydrolase [Caulobacter sp.]